MGRSVWIILMSLSMLTCFGCARHHGETTSWDDALLYRAPLDSLGLDEFRLLPDEEIAARRAATSRIRDEISGSLEHPEYVRRLVAVTGMTPDDIHAWTDLARECEKAGDWKRALDCIISAQRVVGVLPPEKRRPMRVRLAVARAWLHRDRGEWSQASAWSDSASLLSPEERGVKLLRGICLASRGDVVGAHNSAREIEVKRNEWFEWRWIRGMAEVAQGNLDDAYHWLRDARPVQPWSQRFWRDLATVCERLGIAPEAERFHRYAYNASSLRAGAAAEIRMDVKWPEAAKSISVPAWRGYDRLPAGGSTLGWSRAAADSFFHARTSRDKRVWADLSSTLLSICTRSDFDVIGSLALRGRIYAEVGADELAMNDFTRLMRLTDPQRCRDDQALAWFGRLLIGRKRYRESIPHLERAVELEPNFARAWGDLGLARMMVRRAVAGEEAFSRALELDPAMAAAWYNRGLARYHARRWEESVADLEQALALAPDNKEIQILLQQAAQRLKAVSGAKRPRKPADEN